MSTTGRWTSFGKYSAKIIYKTVEKLLINTGQGCIIKVEIKERRKPKECKMTRQEQIEEKQKTICANCKDKYPKKGYVCPWQDRKTKCYKCEKISEALYNAGYRKVPDGAVVLTAEERDEEMKATNEILAERDDLKEKVESLKSEKEGWKMRYSDSGQKNKKLSVKNAQLKAENEQLKTECALLDDELRIARQDTINVLNELKAKSYVNNYCREVVEIDKIDELLKEYE